MVVLSQLSFPGIQRLSELGIRAAATGLEQEGLHKKAVRNLVPSDSVESPLLCPKILKETLNPCLTQTTGCLCSAQLNAGNSTDEGPAHSTQHQN